MHNSSLFGDDPPSNNEAILKGGKPILSMQPNKINQKIIEMEMTRSNYGLTSSQHNNKDGYSQTQEKSFAQTQTFNLHGIESQDIIMEQ